MPIKQQRDIINFKPDTPTTVTLDTDPASAKQGQRTTKSGKQQYFWTYFVSPGGVFFADKDLNGKLQGYKRGDTVVITNVVPPGNRWGSFTVTSASGQSHPVPTSGDSKLDEILHLLRLVVSHLNVQGAPKENQNPPIKTANDQDLGF